MRIATIESGGENRDSRRLGLVCGKVGEAVVDLTLVAERLQRRDVPAVAAPNDMLKLIEGGSGALSQLRSLAAAVEQDLSLTSARLARQSVRFRAPIERPGKIICLAGNYREHIAESGFAVPRDSDTLTPQLFLKPATTINGDGADIALDHNNSRVGWEVELAVVIGKRGRNIAARDAFDYVFGYTILNDISERGLNSQIPNRRERDKFFDWLAGKWFDTFAPCGPWIVTKDEIPDPHNLEIKLSVNGEVRQQGSTAGMIHRIPEIIAYCSSVMTLGPGDIISTGTPVGAGLGGASTSLSDGDEVVCEIEKIGTLRNRVRVAA
jgi:2-keto-4-pentenoate hydratase/2-oxohepta-3-ene-1,7-dioic acid hydratase in catechol pathway